MITIGINGASGKMGLSLVRLIAESKDLQLVAAIDRSDNPSIGKDIGLMAGLGKALGIRLSGAMDRKADPIRDRSLKGDRLSGKCCSKNVLSCNNSFISGGKQNVSNGASVMIDFSQPAGTMKILKECLKYKTALLIGTTGLSTAQKNKIRLAGKKIACLISPNMSIGANLLFKVAPQIAATLGPEYDIEIVETHHRFKKDAPSGTAIRLGDAITAVTKKKIPTHSLRIGDVVGDHTAIYSTLGERIELTHRVHTRDIFSRGALKVARFLAQARPGFYTMADAIK